MKSTRSFGSCASDGLHLGRAAAVAMMAVVVGLSANSVRACSTPVYRYAMFNWPPSPFRIFSFYQKTPPAGDEAIRKAVAADDQEGPAMTNVLFDAVDASNSKRMEMFPADIKKAAAAATGPLHVVVSPWGVILFQGALEAKDAASLFESPVRTRVGQLLLEGNATVLLILAGKDAQATKKTEKLIDELIARSAAGKLLEMGYGPEKDAGKDTAPSTAQDSDPEDPSRRPLKIARVTLSPDDPAEKWFLKVLSVVEPGLDEYAGQPMVYAVYGRGRVMPPLVGDGINAENLTDCVAFLSGACSCMVKDQNPGVDIPMRWDWDAVAEKLAEEEEADSDLGPPARGRTPAEPVKQTVQSPPAERENLSQNHSALTPGPSPSDRQSGRQERGEEGAGHGSKPAAPAAQVAEATTSTPTPSPGSPLLLWYGVGIAVASILVVLVGIFMVRGK